MNRRLTDQQGLAAGKPGHLTIEEWLLARVYDLVREWAPRIRRLLLGVLAVLFVSIVLLIGVEIRSTSRARSVHDLTRQVKALKADADEMRSSVDDIKKIADTVEAGQADASAQGAVREGLRKIDLICRRLDCDQAPSATTVPSRPAAGR